MSLPTLKKVCQNLLYNQVNDWLRKKEVESFGQSDVIKAYI